MFEKCKKIISVLLIFSIAAPYVFLTNPQSAEAAASGSAVIVVADQTRDVTFLPKEMVLDMAGKVITRMLIAALTNSIVNWINSGFEGQPTFLNNSADFFKDLANQTSGAFINALGAEDLLCGAFKPQIILGLKYSYKTPAMQKFKCTINDAIKNWDDFMNDFSAGGWQGWLTMTTQSQNNPYGAYLMALDEMEARVAAKASIGKQELAWGGGFVTLKKCKGGDSQESFCEDSCMVETPDGPGDAEASPECISDCMDIEISTSELCDYTGGKMENTTPGAIVADELKKAFGASFDELAASDEIGEAIAAIINALVNQLLSQGLKALSGGGSSGSSGGNDGWYDTGKKGERDNLLEKAGESIDDEKEYKELREDAISAMVDGLGILGDATNCYGEQAEVISSLCFNSPNGVTAPTIGEIDAKIEKVSKTVDEINAATTNFEADVKKAEENIEELENVKLELMMAETTEELSAAMEKYGELKARLHGAGDISQARSDLDDIEKRYNDALNELNECRAKLEELKEYLLPGCS